jgi:hypothetical protein
VLLPPGVVAAETRRRARTRDPDWSSCLCVPQDAEAHTLVLFVPPALPSLVRHARAACVCLCSTAHNKQRGVCAPVTLCGGCCWWAGIHRPAAAAACQSFFYGFYRELTELSASSFRLLFCWPGWSPVTSTVALRRGARGGKTGRASQAQARQPPPGRLRALPGGQAPAVDFFFKHDL